MLASEFGPRARYEDFRKLVQQYLNSQRRRSYVRFPRVQTLTALRCYDPHEDSGTPEQPACGPTISRFEIAVDRRVACPSSRASSVPRDVTAISAPTPSERRSNWAKNGTDA